MNANDLKLLAKAYQFSSIKHQNQRRKSGDIPYINHPIEVANILAQCDINDVQIICGAILHDTVQDTQTTPEQIQKQFGSKVRQYVLECTDDKSLSKVQRKKAQIQHAKHISNGAKYIKIADKISNNRSVIQNAPPKWTQQIKFGYHIWSEAVFNNAQSDNEKLNNLMTSLLQKGGIYKYNQEERKTILQQYYVCLIKK